MKLSSSNPPVTQKLAFRARAGAAPLKRAIRRRTCGATCAFRARAGAAPLKLSSLESAPFDRASFRARAGAAPLKQYGTAKARFSEPPFRARAGAAPLKPESTQATALDPKNIPRPRGRGPVEAYILSSRYDRDVRPFRARAGAAPLKPVRSFQCFIFDIPFRARAGAAPLKQMLRRPPAPNLTPIPRPRGRGPVEAWWYLSVQRNVRSYHSAPARARPR